MATDWLQIGLAVSLTMMLVCAAGWIVQKLVIHNAAEEMNH